MNLGYDLKDPNSIHDYACRLFGKTLGDFLTDDERLELVENVRNKGDLGSLIEKYFFHINPGNKSEPDFSEAGLELKTSAVLKRKTNSFSAKERMKLTSINFNKLVHESWDDNSLMRKCELLLLLFTLYESGIPVVDRRFVVMPKLWHFSHRELRVIRNDWDTIVQKIKDGKAHELSGSDTMYLEACTSGASGQMSTQPFSDIPAKTRSFALKASFVNASMLYDAKYYADTEPLLKADESPADFESIIISRLKPFYGRDVETIEQELAPQMRKSKQHLARLAYLMLGVTKNHAEEFEKAGIEIKSIKIQRNGSPKESMSFPAFSYMELIDQDWEDSVFKQKLERKFLFMVYQADTSGVLQFKKSMFWAMPLSDLSEAERVWNETKLRIIQARAHELPLSDFSKVAHVRNHAKDSKPESRIPTPHNGPLAQKGFWLNASYIKKQIGEQ